MAETLFGGTLKMATISECGTYRYELIRRWDVTKPCVGWIMLNPSTADAELDDPTIRRCMGFWAGRVAGCEYELHWTEFPSAPSTPGGGE